MGFVRKPQQVDREEAFCLLKCAVDSLPPAWDSIWKGIGRKRKFPMGEGRFHQGLFWVAFSVWGLIRLQVEVEKGVKRLKKARKV